MSDKEVAIVLGASRGIGRQIAIDLARNGYYVVVAAKSTWSTTSNPNPNSKESTIHTVVNEIRKTDGDALAVPCDVRSAGSIDQLIATVLGKLCRIDVLIYNAGAIWWSAIATTPLKRYKLMQEVNSEGLFATVQAVLPHFLERKRGRIIVVCPPIYQRFTHGKAAYAMTKIAMSVLVKGLAKDFDRMGDDGKRLTVTGIWPACAIESAATEQNRPVDGKEVLKDLRKAEIFGDAILAMLRASYSTVNGLLDTDEDFLRRVEGYDDRAFDKYAVVPGSQPRRIMPKAFPSLRVEEEDDQGVRMDSVRTKESSKL